MRTTGCLGCLDRSGKSLIFRPSHPLLGDRVKEISLLFQKIARPRTIKNVIHRCRQLQEGLNLTIRTTRSFIHMSGHVLEGPTSPRWGDWEIKAEDSLRSRLHVFLADTIPSIVGRP